MEFLWMLIGGVFAASAVFIYYERFVIKKSKSKEQEEKEALEALKFNLSRDNERITLMIQEKTQEYNKRASEVDKLNSLFASELEEIEKRKIVLGELKSEIEKGLVFKRQQDEIVSGLEKRVAEKTQALEEVTVELVSLMGLANSMRKRQSYELRGNMLEFESWELVELKELEGLVGRFKNPVPIYKAIYDAYYKEKMVRLSAPYAGKCGIYRIWVEEDGVETSYVGQTVDFAAR